MKKVLKGFDVLVLRGFLRQQLRHLREQKFRSRLQQVFGLTIDLHYHIPGESELTSLFDQFGSDKGSKRVDGHPYPWPPHSYSDVYEFIFTPLRQSTRLLVECGIGTNDPVKSSSMGTNGRPGASLRAWDAFFPHARIVGCDIDENILVHEGKIESFQCDQTSQESITSFRTRAGLEPETADIIIDDGLHEFEAGRIFFENMIDVLSDTGTYIIEDVRPNDAFKYADYFSKKSFSTYIWNISRSELPVGYNVIFIIRKQNSSKSCVQINL